MELLRVSSEDYSQFKFIISDKNRRSLWFPCIIKAIEELVKRINKSKSNTNIENYSYVRIIRETTYFLTKKRGELMKELDTYLHWFRSKNTNSPLDDNDDLYYTNIFTKLNEIDEKSVDDNIKEYYNMFGLDSIGNLRLSDDITNMLFKQAGVNSTSIYKMKISITTIYSPREFYPRLPKDFPFWFLDCSFDCSPITNVREE